MNDSWLDGTDAPWLGQKSAAKQVQAVGSPYEMDPVAKPASAADTEAFDPSRYRSFLAGTD
ncbi:MAG: hypothetical protein H6905_03330 [Hyphomicrobiales bacterium]|nr:hypothetical protein [Hyphomicrobiales bacterium]